MNTNKFKILGKFFAIVLVSIILAIVFGYWFGKLEVVFSGNPIYGNFILPISTNTSIQLIGILFAQPFFIALLNSLLFVNLKTKIISSVIGFSPTVGATLLLEPKDIVLTLALILFGYLIGELILLIKTKLKV